MTIFFYYYMMCKKFIGTKVATSIGRFTMAQADSATPRSTKIGAIGVTMSAGYLLLFCSMFSLVLGSFSSQPFFLQTTQGTIIGFAVMVAVSFVFGVVFIVRGAIMAIVDQLK